MTVMRTICPGHLVLESPDPGFDGGREFSQKIAVAKRWIIINLEIRLGVMAAHAYRKCSLMARLNHSISGTCYFLDTQLRDMTRSSTSARSGSN